MTRRILVTGATGFVGQALCEVLWRAGYVIRAALRIDRPLTAAVAEKIVMGDIESVTDWTAAVEDVDVVIHTAARVHIVRDSRESRALYMASNALATARLAEASAASGVRRFIYLSSVKVNGEGSNKAYAADDEPCPRDAYGESKWAGEQSLAAVAARTGMQALAVRPPLVYGPGVRANFLRLLKWVDKGWPLPLAAIHNQRSLVSIWNLCDLLVNVVTNPAAPGRVWMISDGHDLSTPELIRRIAAAMHRRARLLPLPASVLRLGATLAGRAEEGARLCDSLTVDITATRRELGWAPPVALDEALTRTVQWYSGLKTEARNAL